MNEISTTEGLLGEPQGFENSALNEVNSTLGNASPLASDTTPLVSVARVQYNPTHELTHLLCSNNVLLLGLRSKPPHLVKINLEQPDTEEVIELTTPPATSIQPAPVPNFHLTALFLDPTGRHIVAVLSSGDVCYYYTGWPPEGNTKTKRAKPLNKLRNVAVTALAWSPFAFHATALSASTTKEILFGTAEGKILESCLDADVESSRPFSRGHHDRYLNAIASIPEKETIISLRYFVWQNKAGPNSRKRQCIVAVTETKIVQYIAATSSSSAPAGNSFESLMVIYKEALPKSLELPGLAVREVLQVFYKKAENWSAQSIAWLTSPGIYRGQVALTSQEAGDGIIDGAQLLPYPSSSSPSTGSQDNDSEVPIALALTEYHFILLYKYRLRVVRSLDDETVFDAELDMHGKEHALSINTDVLQGTFWICTNRSIFEVSITEDDRDVWKVHLKRKAFDAALTHAKSDQQRDVIKSQKADSLFESGRHMQAADLYAQTSRRFEDVALKFIDSADKDALRNYLGAKLNRLHRSELTQRMMLATWLLENFLSKLNQLQDTLLSENDSDMVENLTLEQNLVNEDLSDFLKTYRNDLDKSTVYDLTLAYGHSETFLKYAALIDDFAAILSFHIRQANWLIATETLNRQKDLDLYYTNATVLLQYEPRAVIECFMKQPALNLRNLLPALMFPYATENTSRLIIDYLKYAIFKLHNTDSLVHNALLTLLVKTSSEEDTLQFLSDAPEDFQTSRPYYDLDYALRLCESNNRTRSSIRICSKMQMWESAVDQSLSLGDIELAKMNADGPDEQDIFLRKKLWLKVAKHVVGDDHDMKAAMKFLDSTDLIKIEDLLPFFPDFVTIDDFKEDICGALERYSTHIERLRDEMEQATESAEAIKREIQDLSTRLVVLDAAEKCMVCSQTLMTRQFYVFPCQHAFHADCLVAEVTSFLSTAQIRKVLDLQNQLAQISVAAEEDNRNSSSLPSLPSFGLKPIPRNKLTTAGMQSIDQLRKLVIPDALVSAIGGGVNEAVKLALPGNHVSKQDSDQMMIDRNVKLEKISAQLDQILAANCVFCDRSLAALDQPFLKEGEESVDW